MIKEVFESDRESFIRLMKEFYDSDCVLNKIPNENFDRTFDEIINSRVYANGYLFELDGKAVGYALTANTYSNESGGMIVWIEEIYIQPEYRSRGLGKEFFKYIENNMGRDVKKIRLEVREDNERAVKLYERLGFSKVEYMQMVKVYK